MLLQRLKHLERVALPQGCGCYKKGNRFNDLEAVILCL